VGLFYGELKIIAIFVQIYYCMHNQTPELLLPAGNTEAFYAALEGGADAIYLGLRNFNARGRAVNFSESHLLVALQEARNRKVKIYITLNTVIKNSEIDDLLDVLTFLDRAGIDAVIIQDWGLYYILRLRFPKLVIHASTQMGNHNSLGAEFSKQQKIERVILARELTMPELSKIASNSQVELELFVHGALCYSFSGLCFFSSYLGGRGANRGLCAQPCRRLYKDQEENKFLFNLKDNQQLPNLEKLKKLGIRSLKVEGRMKSADYVYRVAKSYRMAIDQPEKKDEAEELLKLDFGREKIAYFLGKDVKEGIADTSNTGLSVGNVERVKNGQVFFQSNTTMQEGDRVRVRNVKDDSTINIKLRDLVIDGDQYCFTYDGKEKIQAGDELFWVGRREQRFPGKFQNLPHARIKSLPYGEKKRFKQQLLIKSRPSKPRLFIRIDQPDWLRKLRLDDPDGVILSFSRKELEQFDFSVRFIQQFKHKVFIELPKFISEEHLDAYRQLLAKIEGQGISQFFVSHLSQKLLLSKNVQVSANENVYVYNDAAAKMLNENAIRNFCYPIENDFENLRTMQNKQGIVVLHAYPELFYSRMPVQVANEENQFEDDTHKVFQKTNRDGITVVTPDAPVSLFQYRNQLLNEGFTNFMIDLSHEKPSKHVAKKLLNKFRFAEQYQPSTTFNFKKGLK